MDTADLRPGDVVAPAASVSIDLSGTPVLSYALAHNRVPVVSRLALSSTAAVAGATVRLSVRDPEGSIDLTKRVVPVAPASYRDAGRVRG